MKDSRESFFLHLRPRSCDSFFRTVKSTWLLGFFAVFFLVVEIVTGVVLMIYYVPSPAEAYESVVRISTAVPFGSLVRNLHRLAGECMIIVVTLHMLRVLLTGAYQGARRFTWFTGLLLWLCTLVLAFSGYLLPWDQLAYWAVTIGTSIADTIPGFGHQITSVLRGGETFGQDGLLRFYLLHIVATPALMMVFLAIHYYRVARLHGITPYASAGARVNLRSSFGNEQRRQAFFPVVPLSELSLSLLALTTMVIVAAFLYDAPLQYHADPLHTPANTQAPWFFLWLQGALKLGDTFVMGICFPFSLFVLLIALPYVDTGRHKWLKKRLGPFIIAVSTAVFCILTALGLPNYGGHLNPVTALFRAIAPEEGQSRFHRIDFVDLPQMIYTTDRQPPSNLSTMLRELLADYSRSVKNIPEAEGYLDPQGVVLIEDWQVDLKRITLRIHWQDQSVPSQPMSAETSIFLHRLVGKQSTQQQSAL